MQPQIGKYYLIIAGFSVNLLRLHQSAQYYFQ
jgi:hypothetical protein